MAEEKLRVTIEAEGSQADSILRELTDQIESLKSEASDAADELKGMDDATEEMGDSAREAGDSVEESGDKAVSTKAKWDMLKEAAGYVKQAFDMTVVAAASWDDEMGDLAQLTGTTVQETSRLAATLELLGIKQDGLTKIVKAFTAQGLQPTMANVRALAAEYQAIQDPVERNEYLFKRFGRQAADVAEVLGKDTKELDEFTAAAQRSGKVINEETAVAAEKLNVNIAKLQQRAEGVGIAIGNFVIPSIVGLFEGMDELSAAVERGDISWVEYASRLAAVATGHGTAATLTVGLAEHVERLKDDTAILATTTDTSTVAIDAWSASMTDAYPSASDLAGITFAQLDATDKLAFGMGKLTEQLIFQAASEGLSSEAKLQLAASMGLINQESVIAAEKIEALKSKYDINRDGVIDLKEATSGYLSELRDIKGAIDAIPDNQTKMVTIVTQGGDVRTGDFGQLRTSDANANRQVLRAEGGPVSFGREYIVGERGPELFVPNQSGTIIPNNQINNTNMGGVTIVIQGVTDPEANVRAFSRALAAQVRGLTQSGAAMLGG